MNLSICLFGSGGEKAKPEKTGKSFLRKRKNLPKREKTKKPPQNGSGPTPHDLGQNTGNLGPDHTRKRAVWGVWDPAHALGAIWAEKRGFWVRGTAQAQNRLRNGDLGSGERPGRKIRSERRIWGAKWAQTGGFGVNPAPPAQNEVRNGDLGSIARPRRRIGSEIGVLG